MFLTMMGCFTDTTTDVDGRLAELEDRIAAAELHADGLETELGAALDRVDGLEEDIAALQGADTGLDARLVPLEDDLERLQTMVQVTDDGDLILGLGADWDGGMPTRTTTKDVIVTDANLFVVNGEGGSATVNGDGNLIIGYNEDDSTGSGVSWGVENTGSHNLVLGPANSWTAWGTVVVGQDNMSASPLSMVIGLRNAAAAELVLGDLDPGGGVNLLFGADNQVGIGARASAVIGGNGNTAGGQQDVIVGGTQNVTAGLGLNYLFGRTGIPWSGTSTSVVEFGCADTNCTTRYFE